MTERTNPPSLAETDGETYESIPWESLRSLDRGPDRRIWYVAAAVLVVVVAVLATVRGGGPQPTIPADQTTVTPPTTAAPTTTSTTLQAVTEADLRAVDSAAVERSVAAVAEVAAYEYFTRRADGIWSGVEFDSSRDTFVEYARTVSVTPLGGWRFEVAVVVSVLDAAPGEGFVRRDPRGISLIIDGMDGAFRPSGLPAPADLPLAAATAVTEGEPITDEAGIVWPMAGQVDVMGDPVGDAAGVPVSRTAP